jgi:hypothetical protein
MIFARETFVACFNEVQPLLSRHFTELARWKDIPLDPNWSLYQTADEAGALRVFTIRDPSSLWPGATGPLVGYAVFFVHANPHCQTSVQAVQDVLFLDAKLRGRLTGYRFIKWCDKQLCADGVQVVYHQVNTSLDFGPMLERIGYERVSVSYGRRLRPQE